MRVKASARIYRLLKLKFVNNLVFRVRFYYFIYIRRMVRSYDDEHGVAFNDYSKRRLYKGDPNRRILKLIEPLSVIESLDFNAEILVIGCRYETDMLYLVGNGFYPSRMRGLDMFSYSPWTDLGNMHAMSYEDNSWDAVLCGWTIAYSDEPQQAAAEMVRVTRPGGLIAVGVSYYPESVQKEMRARGSRVGSRTHVQTVEAVLALFEPNVDRVFFNHDAVNPGQKGSCLVIFSVKKPDDPS